MSARLKNNVLYPNAVPSNSAQLLTTGSPLVPFAPRFIIPLQHPLVFRERFPDPDFGDWYVLDGQQAANLIDYCGWESFHVLRCVRVRHDFDEHPLVACVRLAKKRFRDGQGNAMCLWVKFRTVLLRRVEERALWLRKLHGRQQ
jgi:hypothetical protein